MPPYTLMAWYIATGITDLVQGFQPIVLKSLVSVLHFHVIYKTWQTKRHHILWFSLSVIIIRKELLWRYFELHLYQ